MQTQIVAVAFTVVFLVVEAIWLIMIRNRYQGLILCTTALVGMEGLALIAVQDRYTMGTQFLLAYLGRLFLIDVGVLLLVWLLFYRKVHFNLNEIRSSKQLGTAMKSIAAFELILRGISSRTKAILVLTSFVIVLAASPLALLFMSIPFFWPLLIAEIMEFPKYLYFSPIQRFLPSFLVGYDDPAIISGWILYLSLVTTIVFTRRSFWFILYLLLVFLLINNVLGCGAALRNL